MATVNALKHKQLENEVKMHFTYLQQSSAHSNSTSMDFTRLLSRVPGTSFTYFQVFYLKVVGLHSKYIS